MNEWMWGNQPVVSHMSNTKVSVGCLVMSDSATSWTVAC